MIFLESSLIVSKALEALKASQNSQNLTKSPKASSDSLDHYLPSTPKFSQYIIYVWPKSIRKSYKDGSENSGYVGYAEKELQNNSPNSENSCENYKINYKSKFREGIHL